MSRNPLGATARVVLAVEQPHWGNLVAGATSSPAPNASEATATFPRASPRSDRGPEGTRRSNRSILRLSYTSREGAWSRVLGLYQRFGMPSSEAPCAWQLDRSAYGFSCIGEATLQVLLAHRLEMVPSEHLPVLRRAGIPTRHPRSRLRAQAGQALRGLRLQLLKALALNVSETRHFPGEISFSRKRLNVPRAHWAQSHRRGGDRAAV